MPHLTILYSPNVEPLADIPALCTQLASAMKALRDENDQAVFPIGGIRVLAYPAAHHAVADSSGDYGFVYFNLRMASGRSIATHQAVGQALTDSARKHLAPLLAALKVGLTLQVDEGHEVFDARFGNLHAVFNKPG